MLEQGKVKNKNLLQLIHDGAHKFYNDPEKGWNAALERYRGAQAKVEEARATWSAFLSGREPPLSIEDAPEEVYRNQSKGGTFEVILPAINEGGCRAKPRAEIHEPEDNLRGAPGYHNDRLACILSHVENGAVVE